MGSSYSQDDFARSADLVYKDILHQPCLLPDIGIDQALLKYSGSDSNAVLQAYSNEMANMVQGYAGNLGSAIGELKSVPNAVGFGALLISMIIEIVVTASPQRQHSSNDHTYSLIQRVFGDEKVSSVRDTMSECLKRYEVYINNTQQLQQEIGILERQLSNHLTILKNSLLHDEQMKSRGLKFWVNGAAFHVQMLIHGARLQACKPRSECVHEIKIAINVYLRSLDVLLEKYKTYKINSDVFIWDWFLILALTDTSLQDPCSMYNYEIEGCSRFMTAVYYPRPCSYGKEIMAALMDVFQKKYEPIKGLKSYFLNIQNNLNSLILERGSFILPVAG